MRMECLSTGEVYSEVIRRGYNPGQNYLRKFSPSCPLSYATKLFPKRRLCGKKTPSPNSMLLYKRPGIRLSFEYTTTLLSGEGGEGRTGTATMFRKMLSKYTIFSTVLSKIVALPFKYPKKWRNSKHFSTLIQEQEIGFCEKLRGWTCRQSLSV